MTTLLRIALIASLVGLLGSLALDVAAVASYAVPRLPVLVLLSSLFPLSLCVVIAEWRVQTVEKDWVTAGHRIYEGVPIWLRMLCIAAFVNAFLGPPLKSPSPIEIAPAALLATYCTFFALFYSIYRQAIFIKRFCLNGHPVSYYNRFCPDCCALLPRIQGKA